MRPEKLLPWLLGGALAAAGWLQGLQWRSASLAAGAEDREGKIIALENELELLRRENESLRSLAQGGGEVKVEPALIDFVESSLGLDFRSTPQVHRIAGEELRDRIVASIEARYGPHGLDSRQQAWVLMGLLNADDRFAAQLAATKAVGARSWFDDQTGEAWVTDRFDPGSIPDQAALIRALARILLHQHYPPPPGWPGDEAAAAREALHHGAAMTVENRYLARQALGNGFTALQENTDAKELLANLSPFVRGLATFPSLRGLPLAGRLMDQGKLAESLHLPPAITAGFFPGHETLAAAPPELPESPGSTLLEESAGMLGIRLWLEPLGDEFTALADGWRGDKYRLSATSDTDQHLIWDVRFDSAENADAFAAAACDLLSAVSGGDEVPAVGAAIETPEGRKLTVLRPAPDRVRLLNQVP
ncbi:hypothetical protein [Luteolibacter marinus]|uniref:hypothetical protein n=1 Tax=Luteolibacter marinus TaxID=2776705 RepID=UPI001868E3B6|nr:hypothetical protein [Luteolibacter marinus]